MPQAFAQYALIAALYHYHFCTTPRYAVFYLPAWGMIFFGLYGLRHG